MRRPFHLSIGVRSIEDSIAFFEGVLKASITHRDPSGYVNVDFFGTQITLKAIPDISPECKELHFGANLPLREFEDLSRHVLSCDYQGEISKPKTVDEGTAMERRKMYVRCPTGYLFELKGFREASV